MVTTDLGACEWFVWDLRRSNLIDRGQLDQIVGEFLSKNPGPSRPPLAEYLVDQGILTDVPGRAPPPGQDPGLRPRAVHAHGRPRRRQHGHGLQGPVQDRQQVVRRQGAAAPQHVERPHRPPQGPRSSSSASTPPSCRSWTSAPPAACTTWPGRSSRARRSTRSSQRAGQARRRSRPPSTPCRSPRGWTSATSRACSTACSSRRTS